MKFKTGLLIQDQQILVH